MIVTIHANKQIASNTRVYVDDESLCAMECVSVSMFTHKIFKRCHTILSMKHFEHGSNNVAKDFICSFSTALHALPTLLLFFHLACLWTWKQLIITGLTTRDPEKGREREKNPRPDWLNKRKISSYEIKKKKTTTSTCVDIQCKENTHMR